MVPEHLHDAILLAFVQGHSVPALAAHFKVPLRALSEWLSSPPVVALRDSLRELADAQAALATAHARVTSILTLESVAKGAQVSEDVFRASALLIRNTPRAALQVGRDGKAHAARRSRQANEPDNETDSEARNAPSPRHNRGQTDTAAGADGESRTQRTDSPHPRSPADRAQKDQPAASAHEPAQRDAHPAERDAHPT